MAKGGARRKQSFMACPRGHDLPMKFPYGECTPVLCAEEAQSRREGLDGRLPTLAAAKRMDQERRKRGREAGREGTEALNAVAEESRMQLTSLEEGSNPHALAFVNRVVDRRKNHAAKLLAFGMPQGLTGEAAEQWADKRLVELLPQAVVEAQAMLEMGDDAQRQKAMQQILDSTGRGKREVGGSSAPAIVINVGGGQAASMHPWRVEAKAQVIDVSPTTGSTTK
jgi:hypothetical protein